MSFLKAKDLWQPNENYRAQARYKSLVAYNNKLYICTETHTSGETFSENADKFTPVADGGGQLAGTWDMTPLGATLTPMDVTVGASVDSGNAERVVSNVGSSPLSIVSSSLPAAENSPVVVRNVIDIVTYNPVYLYFGFVNIEADLNDFFNLLNEQPMPSITGGVMLSANQDNFFFSINLSTGVTAQVNDNLLHSTGQLVYFKYEIVDNVYNVYAKVETNPTYQLMTQFPASSVPNGVKPFVMGLYAASSYNGTFNILSFGGNPGSPELPSDPIGKRYLVSAAGSYNEETTQVGDIVEFVSLNDIVVTRDANVFQNSIDSVLSSIQQQIDTNAPKGKKEVQVLTNLTFQNQINYFNMSVQLSKEVLIFDFGDFSDKTYMRVQLSQKSIDNVDCIVIFKFGQTSTENVLPNSLKLIVDTAQYSVIGDAEDAGGGSGTILSYGFDLANTRSLTFHYVDGRLIPIGRKKWSVVLANNFKISSSYLMSDTQTINYDLTPLSSFDYPLSYSDTNRIILTAQNDINSATVVINRGDYTLLDSVNESGISLEIDSNGYTLYNISVYYADKNDNLVLIKQFYNMSPVTGYYRYIFFPKSLQLVSDIRNP